MKTKENTEQKNLTFDKNITDSKPKSLRPVRSMVAVRSLKPKTAVANLNLSRPATEISERS